MVAAEARAVRCEPGPERVRYLQTLRIALSAEPQLCSCDGSPLAPHMTLRYGLSACLSGSQRGSQRRQTPSDARRRPTTMVQVRWLIRRRPATARDGQISPEKRKVGSSTLPLTTISQPRWQPAPSALSLFRSSFRLYFSRSAGVCRGVSSCPWGTRGTARNPDLWDFCGARRRPSLAHAVGCSGTPGSGFQGRLTARVAGSRRPGLTGLPRPADLRGS